ncbi:Glutaminase [Nocardioides dokdonensis FR1436]|uniref:Glutaminase n=1 Tax=Nocardioides dokdonensis FR1436 TaxID=1300347 RepID=A0A1A9GJJ4_9ACTN|nr:glutaminase [Nocardioides dokdonensis]ANH37671.1 Glutaminase [Nocardioides dokdonensis FR1436]
MDSPIPDYLHEVLSACGADTSGAVADYIPELAQVDPDRLGVALTTVDGAVYEAGDCESRFTIQSISKPFVYALALQQRGLEAVLDQVDVEPSGEAFNELSLEKGSGRPLNPMINAGAIVVHTMLGDPGDPQGRCDQVLAGLSAFAGRPLDVDEAAYGSETATAFRNYAIANMLRSRDSITEDPEDVVAAYTRQCSVRVSTRDLALMAATLANGGVHPVSEEQVVEEWVARQVMSVMATCGMYDSAGDWISTVGFPAKSGVSGGIIGALPGQLGIAAFSPRLDPHGSSVRGVEVCRHLSADMGLHMMDAPQPVRATIRRMHTVQQVDGSAAKVFSLHGSLQFAGTERLVRDLAEADAAGQLSDAVVLDLTRVHSINAVARRMLLETVRRLSVEGCSVTVVDPESTLPDPDCGDGLRPTVVGTVAEAAALGGG